MMNKLPKVHMMTCPSREPMMVDTVERWRALGWPDYISVKVDRFPEMPGEQWGTPGRMDRLTTVFGKNVIAALNEPGSDEDWMLFLEDDLEFHPLLRELVASWPALEDERCMMASLFNPSLRWVPDWGLIPRAFAALPGAFLGAQALLLRRGGARWAMERWGSVRGAVSQRLALIFGGPLALSVPGASPELRGSRYSLAPTPIWVHEPSLVQHVGVDSSWGARVQKALDFNPEWRPAADSPEVTSAV